MYTKNASPVLTLCYYYFYYLSKKNSSQTDEEQEHAHTSDKACPCPRDREVAEQTRTIDKACPCHMPRVVLNFSFVLIRILVSYFNWY